jgi:hypothetical protein
VHAGTGAPSDLEITMHKSDVFTKILAVAGTLLVWFPLILPFVFGFVSMAGDGRFRFDYFIPAELFPLILVGGILLLWAAFRAGAPRRLIGGGLLLAVILLVASQEIAVLTGLASGAAAPEGWRLGVVAAGLAGFVVSVVAVGVGGARLVRGLLRGPSTD